MDLSEVHLAAEEQRESLSYSFRLGKVVAPGLGLIVELHAARHPDRAFGAFSFPQLPRSFDDISALAGNPRAAE
jgi:hypothetical protein